MKKSGVSLVLVLIVTVFGVFAARSMARTPNLSNFLLRSQNLEEDQQVAGLATCCDMCRYCVNYGECFCEDRGSTLVPLSVCRRKCSSNILVTGQTLGPGKKLAYGNYFFEMQRSCNLVLSNILTGDVLFSSNTSITFEPNCFLSLDDYGRLSIHSTVKGEHFTIFTIPKEESKKGDYIAVLRPDGKVAIYGPRVWFAMPPVVKKNKHDEGDNVYESTESRVRNVLFSGEGLLQGQGLISHNRQNKFVVKGRNLALISFEHVMWVNSNSLCVGRNTTAVLNYKGQLLMYDSITEPSCWASTPPNSEGEYVAAMQDDTRAVVYGPKVVAIPEEESSFEGIRMVTAE